MTQTFKQAVIEGFLFWYSCKSKDKLIEWTEYAEISIFFFINKICVFPFSSNSEKCRKYDNLYRPFDKMGKCNEINIININVFYYSLSR